MRGLFHPGHDVVQAYTDNCGDLGIMLHSELVPDGKRCLFEEMTRSGRSGLGTVVGGG